MKTPQLPIISALAGVVAGVAITTAVVLNTGDSSSDVNGTKEPLYWVAPMDPNYKRDKPGKSPMGMDLIPVYEDSGGSDAGLGTISISPDVVNNLGVRTAKATLRSIHSTILTVGYVQYDQDRLVHIHPRVEGWVEQLYVKAAGDPVKQGQPLYALYSPELVNAQEELLLALNRKNARLIQAAEDRLKALQLADNFIKTLKQTHRIQHTATFYAPQTGVVDNLNIREGFFVKPDTTLLSIGTLDEVWVEAEIFERQASLVTIGLPVTMTLDYRPGEIWQGKVDYVYPALDPKTRTVRLRLRFANELGVLKPNMFAQVEIHARSGGQALVIPREAVIRTGSQDRVVLALGDGRFKSVAVRLGRLDARFAEVKDGLEVNEEVVISAQFLLDSESSKTSDFARMHHGNEPPVSVWVEASVVEVMVDRKMAKLTHRPIEAWGWPEMTMMFSVAEEVDLSELRGGMIIHAQIEKTEDGDFLLTQVHVPENNHLQMDHSKMNHGSTDEVTVDHSDMDHSDMDHSDMDHSE